MTPPNKIFLETSVFIRLLTGDDKKKQQETKELFQHIEAGKYFPYTSNIVFLEIFYVLTKTYKFPKVQVIQDLVKLTYLRNLAINENTDIRKAFELFLLYKIKFSDCLIATQIPSAVILITYDRDFSKIPHLKVATPEKIII